MRDLDYLHQKGFNTLLEHAEDFVGKRLAPAYPDKDGKQTPFKGHPVFIAQHATACCCRGCLEKWHQIAKGRTLTENEIAYICAVIEHWLRQQIEKQSKKYISINNTQVNKKRIYSRRV